MLRPACIHAWALLGSFPMPSLLINRHDPHQAHDVLVCGVQHALNLVFIVVELLLNKIPFEPYMLGWLGLYSSTYGLWAFSFYKVTNRWMYPVSSAAADSIVLSLQCWLAAGRNLALGEAEHGN